MNRACTQRSQQLVGNSQCDSSTPAFPQDNSTLENIAAAVPVRATQMITRAAGNPVETVARPLLEASSTESFPRDNSTFLSTAVSNTTAASDPAACDVATRGGSNPGETVALTQSVEYPTTTQALNPVGEQSLVCAALMSFVLSANGFKYDGWYIDKSSHDAISLRLSFFLRSLICSSIAGLHTS